MANPIGWGTGADSRFREIFRTNFGRVLRPNWPRTGCRTILSFCMGKQALAKPLLYNTWLTKYGAVSITLCCTSSERWSAPAGLRLTLSVNGLRTPDFQARYWSGTACSLSASMPTFLDFSLVVDVRSY